MKPQILTYDNQGKIKEPKKNKDNSNNTNQKPGPQYPHPNNQQNKDELTTKGQAYDMINQRDDEQVLLELRGGFLDEFIYSFPTKQGRVTGLSWAGVKEVARQMGNISIEDLQIKDNNGTYQVKAKARDIKRNVTMYGVTEQSKTLKRKDGTEEPDTHALSKCVSRAQRNAIRGLIPEAFIKEMITKYQDNGNGVN